MNFAEFILIFFSNENFLYLNLECEAPFQKEFRVWRPNPFTHPQNLPTF